MTADAISHPLMLKRFYLLRNTKYLPTHGGGDLMGTAFLKLA